MREIPVSVLASWPTPNLVDPPTRGSALLVFSCLFKALLLIVVPSRVYTRVKIVHNFGCDDVMILGASVSPLLVHRDISADAIIRRVALQLRLLP